MKRWWKILAGVVAVLVLLLVALTLFAGSIVKGTINTAGPRLLGVPMSVQNVHIALLDGHLSLNELVIGNPEGFNTAHAIRVQKVAVSVKMATLFSKLLVIDRIRVERPEITYELRMNGSNIASIQNKLAPTSPAAMKPAPAKNAQKIQINDLLIENGKIRLSSIGMAGSAMTIPLPPIHLTDIGKASQGASLTEVVTKVFGALSGAITGAVTGIGKGIGAVGTGAMDAGKTIGMGAGKMLESAEGLFKK